MTDPAQYTEGDLRAIDQAEGRLASKWSGVESIGRAAKGWAATVGEVSRGYRFTIYDYTNDLSIRDYLAQALELLPAETATKIRERIDPADQQFREATREAPGVIDPNRSEWWWNRVPIVPGELIHDLPELAGNGSPDGSSGP